MLSFAVKKKNIITKSSSNGWKKYRGTNTNQIRRFFN